MHSQGRIISNQLPKTPWGARREITPEYMVCPWTDNVDDMTKLIPCRRILKILQPNPTFCFIEVCTHRLEQAVEDLILDLPTQDSFRKFDAGRRTHILMIYC
jgi:hypothetical protein